VNHSRTFNHDPEFINIIDIIARQYGKLPSEVSNLSWAELFICVRCIVARSERAKKAMKSGKKDEIIFPVISIMDLIDLV
jgi:hypothetical protein